VLSRRVDGVNLVDKQFAISMLGGPNETCRWLGIRPAILDQWPSVLADVQRDRILAAYVRRGAARALRLTPEQFLSDPGNEWAIEQMAETIMFEAVTASLLPRIPSHLRRVDVADRSKRGRPPLNRDRALGEAVTG
jgi:hypothetical protein